MSAETGGVVLVVEDESLVCEAHQEIVNNTGKIYDPDVIKVFQKLWGEGKIVVNLTL